MFCDISKQALHPFYGISCYHHGSKYDISELSILIFYPHVASNDVRKVVTQLLLSIKAFYFQNSAPDFLHLTVILLLFVSIWEHCCWWFISINCRKDFLGTNAYKTVFFKKFFYFSFQQDFDKQINLNNFWNFEIFSPYLIYVDFFLTVS